ncbi:HEAT repeat domain-containing protein [Bremerella cremea]|uniref:HEAT repeat domain-containing protein n=1 Tax=Bremerella cremea TaxID=1031537 RepID=UPI0031ED9C17
MKRSFFAFALLLVAVSFGSVSAATVEQSIENLKSTDEATRIAAIQELGSLGDKAASAVTPLTSLLQDTSPQVAAQAAHALGQIGVADDTTLEGLLALTGSQDPQVRREAISALYALHPGHEKMLPIFAKLLGDADPAVRLRVMNALTETGKPAVPELIAALKSEKGALWACLILRELGPEASDAAPELAKVLTTGKGALKREALLALATMPKAATAFTDAIVKCLDDPTLAVSATYALGRMGTMSPEVEAKIKANVESKDKLLGTMSAWALAFTHPDNEAFKQDAVHRLAQGVGSSNAIIRAMSAQGLISLQAKPETLKAELQDPLNDAGEPVVSNAMGLLSTMGPSAIDYLIAALKHPSTRFDAIAILGSLGKEGAPATSNLIALINDENPRVANQAVVALGNIGPAAKAATPELTKSLESGEGSIAHNSALALGRIGPDAAEAKATLLKVMQNHSDPAMQLSCAWALLKVDSDSASTREAVLPVLKDAMKSDNPIIQNAAKEMLGKLNSAM